MKEIAMINGTRKVRAALYTALVTVAGAGLVAVGMFIGATAAYEDRDVSMVRGAGQAWAVWNECFEAPTDCEAILAEVNGDGDGVKFFEDGSAYLAKDGRKYQR